MIGGFIEIQTFKYTTPNTLNEDAYFFYKKLYYATPTFLPKSKIKGWRNLLINLIGILIGFIFFFIFPYAIMVSLLYCFKLIIEFLNFLSVTNQYKSYHLRNRNFIINSKNYKDYLEKVNTPFEIKNLELIVDTYKKMSTEDLLILQNSDITEKSKIELQKELKSRDIPKVDLHNIEIMNNKLYGGMHFYELNRMTNNELSDFFETLPKKDLDRYYKEYAEKFDV
jgi:hypothetical protein